MNSVLLVIGSVFVAIAALIHVYIFILESVRWSKPSTWRSFGLKTQEQADVVKPMAFNQGFYNLFLAIGAGLGILLIGTTHTAAGLAVALFAGGCMVAAALVLVISSPRLARAAAIQGLAPLIGIVLLGIALLVG